MGYGLVVTNVTLNIGQSILKYRTFYCFELLGIGKGHEDMGLGFALWVTRTNVTLKNGQSILEYMTVYTELKPMFSLT